MLPPFRRPQPKPSKPTLSALRRLGARAPGRRIGLRINPRVAVGGNDKLTYSGAKPTKFGLYPEQWGEALAIAKQFGLRIETLHLHAGCGVLTDQIALWCEAFERALSLRPALPHLTSFNVGGGLGVQHSATWGSLDLAAWSTALRKTFAHTGLRVWVEPGDYIAQDAGLLVLTVNAVETKGGTCFVGVNGGFNIAPEPAFYDLPCEPVPCRPRCGPLEPATIAGNINEALDLWYSDILMPPLAEGDRIAFLNAGAYAASMSSNHCLRGDFEEILLPS